MSPDLIAFLKAWHDWATNGAPEGEPFNRIYGLCDNIGYFRSFDERQQDAVYDELTALFGGKIFPFGTDDEYQELAVSRTQHECPKRLAWVRERLIEAGELRNCDDCDFSTTEQDVTVCPDRTCRGSVA